MPRQTKRGGGMGGTREERSRQGLPASSLAARATGPATSLLRRRVHVLAVRSRPAVSTQGAGQVRGHLVHKEPAASVQ
eukprot:8431366-Alexandrium_andersonii.AAC.1